MKCPRPQCATVAVSMNFCPECGSRLLRENTPDRIPIPSELVTFAEAVREESPEYVVALSIGIGDPSWAVRVQHPTGRFDRQLIEDFGTLAVQHGCVGEFSHLQLAQQDIFTIWVKGGER